MTASAMMMQACLLQQQQASVSATLGYPSYFGLPSLFNNFLPTSSLFCGFPMSSLLENCCTPLSTSLSASPADGNTCRSVVVHVITLSLYSFSSDLF